MKATARQLAGSYVSSDEDDVPPTSPTGPSKSKTTKPAVVSDRPNNLQAAVNSPMNSRKVKEEFLSENYKLVCSNKAGDSKSQNRHSEVNDNDSRSDKHHKKNENVNDSSSKRPSTTQSHGKLSSTKPSDKSTDLTTAELERKSLHRAIFSTSSGSTESASSQPIAKSAPINSKSAFESDQSYHLDNPSRPKPADTDKPRETPQPIQTAADSQTSSQQQHENEKTLRTTQMKIEQSSQVESSQLPKRRSERKFYYDSELPAYQNKRKRFSDDKRIRKKKIQKCEDKAVSLKNEKIEATACQVIETFVLVSSDDEAGPSTSKNCSVKIDVDYYLIEDSDDE